MCICNANAMCTQCKSKGVRVKPVMYSLFLVSPSPIIIIICSCMLKPVISWPRAPERICSTGTRWWCTSLWHSGISLPIATNWYTTRLQLQPWTLAAKFLATWRLSLIPVSSKVIAFTTAFSSFAATLVSPIPSIIIAVSTAAATTTTTSRTLTLSGVELDGHLPSFEDRVIQTQSLLQGFLVCQLHNASMFFSLQRVLDAGDCASSVPKKISNFIAIHRSVQPPAETLERP